MTERDPLLRIQDAGDGFNIIIDNRWAAWFPRECSEQAAFLVEQANRAHGEDQKQ